jgi:hypothetical protein
MDVSKHAVNQLEDFLDRNPICLKQADRGQERIFIKLESRHRHFTIFCQIKETAKQQKRNTLANVREQESRQNKKEYSMYLQQQLTSGLAAQPRPIPAGGAPS